MLCYVIGSGNADKEYPIMLGYLEKTRFKSPHYQSIVSTKDSTVMSHYHKIEEVEPVPCMCDTTTHKCRTCNSLCCGFCAEGEMNDHRHRDLSKCGRGNKKIVKLSIDKLVPNIKDVRPRRKK